MATCKDNLQVREKLVDLLNDAIEWAGTFDATGTCYSLNFGVVADVLIANGVTVQEWIPVSERLPDDGEQVLACTKHGRAFSAHCERGRFRVSGSVTVTHWMPMPTPPKGE